MIFFLRYAVLCCGIFHLAPAKRRRQGGDSMRWDFFHSIFPCELTGKRVLPSPSPGPDSRDQGTFNPILWSKTKGALPLPCRDVITKEVKRIQGRDTRYTPRPKGTAHHPTPSLSSLETGRGYSGYQATGRGAPAPFWRCPARKAHTAQRHVFPESLPVSTPYRWLRFSRLVYLTYVDKR